MRKSNLMLLFFMMAIAVNNANAQQVISTAGDYFSNSAVSLSFTVGEPVIATHSAAGYIITQGFQQVFPDSVPGPPSNRLYVKAFLQAPYAGNSSMQTGLNTAGYLPLSQPYSTSPWNYNGSEQVSTMPSGVVDWVLVEIRSSVDTIVARRAALLFNNGMIFDTNLTAGIYFDGLAAGSYYVVIDHRNHMPVMTASPVTLPDQSVRDLSNPSTTPAWGGNNAQASLGNGVNGMITGDVTKDGNLKYSGPSNDRAPILTRIIAQQGGTAITQTTQGYYREDLSMDGTVKYSGPGNDQARIIQNLVNLTGNSTITSIFACPVPAGVVKN